MGIKKADLLKLAGDCEQLLGSDKGLQDRFHSSISHWLNIIKQLPEQQPAAGDISSLSLFNQFKQAEGALKQLKKNIATAIGPTAYFTDEQKYNDLKLQIARDMEQPKPYLELRELHPEVSTQINLIQHLEKQAYPNLLRMINQGLQNKNAPFTYAEANNFLQAHRQQWQQLDQELRSQHTLITEDDDTLAAQRQALAETLNAAGNLINRAQILGTDSKILEYKNHLQEKIVTLANAPRENIKEVIQALNLDIAELNQLVTSREQGNVQEKTELNQKIINLTFAFEERTQTLLKQREAAGLNNAAIKDLAQSFREENSRHELKADASQAEVITFFNQKLENLKALSTKLEAHIQTTQEELSKNHHETISAIKDNIGQQFLKLQSEVQPFINNFSPQDRQSFLAIKTAHEEIMKQQVDQLNSVALSEQIQMHLSETQKEFTDQIDAFDDVLTKHQAATAIAENFTISALNDYVQKSYDKETLSKHLEGKGPKVQIDAAFILKEAGLLDSATDRLANKSFCKAVVELNSHEQATSEYLKALIASETKVEFLLHANHLNAHDVTESDTQLFKNTEEIKQWILPMLTQKDEVIHSFERIKGLAPKQYNQGLFRLTQKDSDFAKLLEKSERIEVVIPFLSTIVPSAFLKDVGEETSSRRLLSGKNYTRNDLIATLTNRTEAQISLVAETLKFTDQELQKLHTNRSSRVQEKSDALQEFRTKTLEVFLEKEQPLEQRKLLSRAAHESFPSNDWGKKIINSLIGFINKVVHLFSTSAEEIKPLSSTTHKQFRDALKEIKGQQSESATAEVNAARVEEERVHDHDEEVAPNPAPT